MESATVTLSNLAKDTDKHYGKRFSQQCPYPIICLYIDWVLFVIDSSQLKILTVNCQMQGLGDINKRRDVFKIKYNIYFLQDTHFVLKDENFIRTQYGREAFFCSYKSYSSGVEILFNDNWELEINAEI